MAKFPLAQTAKFPQARKAKKKYTPPPLPPPPQPQQPQQQPTAAPAPSPQAPLNSPFEKDLKENQYLADFVKYMGLKLAGTKPVEKTQNKEMQNGHAADDSLNAEDAKPDEEDSGEPPDSGL
jgi:uncharacterized membrane protein